MSNEWEDDFAILSSENVGLAVETAGLGSRFGALALDSLLQILFILLIAFLSIELFNLLPQKAPWVQWIESIAGGLLILLVAGVLIAYNFFFEWLWAGQTPGKRRLGLRVMQSDGMMAGTWSIFVRNMLRTIDFMPGFYAVGAVTALANPHNRRVGDLVAGTIVARDNPVHAKHHRVLDINEAATVFLDSFDAQFATAPIPNFPQNAASQNFMTQNSSTQTAVADAPISWARLDEEERELLMSFVQRRDSLKADARARLAQSVAARLSTRLKLETPPKLAAESFLMTLLMAFRDEEARVQASRNTGRGSEIGSENRVN